MTRKIVKISVFFLMFSLLNCKNETKQLVKKSFNENVNQQEIILFDFPDTIPAKTTVYGKIKYNRDMDITNNEISGRHTFFHITMTNKKIEDLTLEKIKAMKHLTYEDTLKKGTFSFKMGSANTGNNLLIGVIEDIIILKKVNGDGKIKIQTNETYVSKNVFVE